MKQEKNILKMYFETGDKPTQTQYRNLIDSLRHMHDKIPLEDLYLEGYDEEGTRGNGIITRLGDFDDSNNGTKLEITDDLQEIKVSGNLTLEGGETQFHGPVITNSSVEFKKSDDSRSISVSSGSTLSGSNHLTLESGDSYLSLKSPNNGINYIGNDHQFYDATQTNLRYEIDSLGNHDFKDGNITVGGETQFNSDVKINSNLKIGEDNNLDNIIISYDYSGGDSGMFRQDNGVFAATYDDGRFGYGGIGYDTVLNIKNGNVGIGIGNNTPTSDLDVNGNVNFSGTLNVSQEISLPDSAYLYLGNNNDIRLFHDGNNSQLDNFEGDFAFRNRDTSSQWNFYNANTSGTQINTFNLDHESGELNVGLSLNEGFETVSSHQYKKSIYSATNGILIETDVSSTTDKMIELIIEGNSYFDHDSTGPIISRVQAYNYQSSGTIRQTGALSNDPNFTIDIFHYNGKVYFWFEQTNQFQTYSFRTNAGIGSSPMRIVNVTNAVKPTTGVTNNVSVTPIQILTSTNFNEVVDDNFVTVNTSQTITSDKIFTSGLEANGGFIAKDGAINKLETEDLGLIIKGNSATRVTLDAVTGNDSIINFDENGIQKAKLGFDTSDGLFKIVTGTGAFSSNTFTLDSSGNSTQSGEATFDGTIKSDSTYGYAIGGVPGYQRIQYHDPETEYAFLTAADSYANIRSHNINATGLVTASSFIGDGSALTNISQTALPNNLAYKDVDNNFTASQNITGSLTLSETLVVNSSSVLKGKANFQNNLALLNKASNSYLTWATRNTSGSEVVYDLSNIGSIVVNNGITVSSTSIFGGGFGATGASIESNGNISTNGTILSDSTITGSNLLGDWNSLDTSDFVRTTGDINETITGEKTFTKNMRAYDDGIGFYRDTDLGGPNEGLNYIEEGRIIADANGRGLNIDSGLILDGDLEINGDITAFGNTIANDFQGNWNGNTESDFMRATGNINETITGEKTFSDKIKVGNATNEGIIEFFDASTTPQAKLHYNEGATEMWYENLEGGHHRFTTDVTVNGTSTATNLIGNWNGNTNSDFMRATGNVTEVINGIKAFSGSETYIQGNLIAETSLDVFNDIACDGLTSSNSYRVSGLNIAPSSSSDNGTTGDIRYTADHIYICTTTDTWKRTALSTW